MHSSPFPANANAMDSRPHMELNHKVNFIVPFKVDPNLPSVSKYVPDSRNLGLGQVFITEIQEDTTIIEEFYSSDVEIHFIKLLKLGSYPLASKYLQPYSQVRYCEIWHFMKNINKVLHFISGLPQLEKVIIGHDAICPGRFSWATAVDAATTEPPETFPLRPSSSLKRANVKVETHLFRTEPENRKYAIAQRIQKIITGLLVIAPNIEFVNKEFPPEITFQAQINVVCRFDNNAPTSTTNADNSFPSAHSSPISTSASSSLYPESTSFFGSESFQSQRSSPSSAPEDFENDDHDDVKQFQGVPPPAGFGPELRRISELDPRLQRNRNGNGQPRHFYR